MQTLICKEVCKLNIWIAFWPGQARKLGGEESYEVQKEQV